MVLWNLPSPTSQRKCIDPGKKDKSTCKQRGSECSRAMNVDQVLTKLHGNLKKNISTFHLKYMYLLSRKE